MSNCPTRDSLTCFCGRSYLSQTSLYTHQKLKHNGRNSEESAQKAAANFQTDRLSRDEFSKRVARFLAWVDDQTPSPPLDVRAAVAEGFLAFRAGGAEEEYQNLLQAILSALDRQGAKGSSEPKSSSLDLFAGLLIFLWPKSKQQLLKEYFALMVIILASARSRGVSFAAEPLSAFMNPFLTEIFPSAWKKFHSSLDFKILGVEVQRLPNLIVLIHFLLDWFFLSGAIGSRFQVDIEFA